MSPTAIVHLIGLPGVGKYTIARAIEGLAAQRGRHFVVVDNHHTSNVVLSVIGADGVRGLADGVWDRVEVIREVVYETIEHLSPVDWSFIFTNVLVESNPRSAPVIERLERLAEERSSIYLPVGLTCDREELRRRAVSRDRAARHKWIDPDGIADYAKSEIVLDAGGPEIDVTSLAPDQAAAQILEHLGGVPPSRTTKRNQRGDPLDRGS